MLNIERTRGTALGIKIYCLVNSATRPGLKHIVAFIRKPGMERWSCTCEDQLFDKTAKRRHCTHIKQVREQVREQLDATRARSNAQA
jgi:hypothetical protein